MSLFSFLRKTEKNKYSLAISIESGSVSGAIIKFTEKPGVNILAYEKEMIPFQKEISISKHLELMKSSLVTLVSRLCRRGFKIEKIYYIFSSPWCISQTKTIKLNEPKIFKLTESYLTRAIGQEEELIKQGIEKDLSFGDISRHGKIIEKKIIQIKANGYIVNEYNNKLVKNAEISLFSTVVPEEILSTVEEAVSKSYLTNNIYCHSASLATFSVIRDLFNNSEDFIYINISEEMTDVSVVKNGIITWEVTFPFGRNKFVRDLALKLKISDVVADSMIKMHQLKSNDELANLKFMVNMNDASKQWTEKISEIFNKFGEDLYNPQVVYLIGNKDLISVLMEKLPIGDYKIISLEAKKITSPFKIDDIMFKIGLTFLDKLYKI